MDQPIHSRELSPCEAVTACDIRRGMFDKTPGPKKYYLCGRLGIASQLFLKGCVEQYDACVV